MPQFPKQSTQPLTAESYRRAAQRTVYLAQIIGQLSGAIDGRDGRTLTPQGKARLTRAIHDLAMHAKRLAERHRGSDAD